MNYKTENFTNNISESFIKNEAKVFFVKSNNRNKNRIGIIGLIIFLVGLGYKTDFNFEIIQYSGNFKYTLYFIIMVALLFNFMQARNTYFTTNSNSIPLKLYDFIGSFIGGGIFISIFTVLILITTLDRIITTYPAKAIIEKVEITNKETYNGKGKHYYISIISKELNKKIRFDLNKKQYENFDIGKKIKIKFYRTKNGTIYLKNEENPL